MLLLLVGTANWTDLTLLEAGWYTPGVARSAEWRLRYYAERLPALVVGATYYVLPSERNPWLWMGRASKGFVFNVKVLFAFTERGLEAGAATALLRSGADLDCLSALGGRLSERADEAKALSEAFGRQGLIHPAEVLHRASEYVRPAPLYVFGYPYLGSDQLAFIRAAAGDENVLILPKSDAPFGDLTRSAAEELLRSG